MKYSETRGKLFEALARFKEEVPAIYKTSEGRFKYANLATILNICDPILSKHGLTILQNDESKDGKVIVTTTLGHVSNEYQESTSELPLPQIANKIQAQDAGSIISYLRRYDYCAMVGVAAEDQDDDAESVTKNVAEQPVAKTKDPQQQINSGLNAQLNGFTLMNLMGLVEEHRLQERIPKWLNYYQVARLDELNPNQIRQIVNRIKEETNNVAV